MLSQQIKNSGSLLDSIDAVRNWRAVVLLLLTLVAAALVAGLGVLLGGVSFFFVFLFGLAAYAVVFYGANAVGVMVMDEARGNPSRPMMAAVMNSLGTSHRLILVALMIGALYLVGMLALALVLLICKIPFLGPVLYTFVFPVAAVVVGIAMFALPIVVFPLSAPSIWNGATTMQCVSQLLAIARKRLIMVLILMVAVAFISGVVGMLIGAILLTGSLTVAGLSAGILGGGMGGLGGMMGGMMMGGGGMGGFGGMGGGIGGHAIAGAIGGGILYAAAFTLPGMVYLRGASTVYLRAIDGLDLASEQAEMEGKIAAARAKAREMQEQAQAKAQKYAQQGTVTPEAPVAPPFAAPVAPPAYVPPAPVPPPAPVVAPAAAAFTATAPIAPPPYVPPPPPAAPVPPVAAPEVPFPATVFPQTIQMPKGGVVTMKCPKCGAPFLPGDAFCGECGNDLR